MGAVTTLPRSRPLLRDDLDAMPDDGHRYELIDGVLIVSPAPVPRHQMAVAHVYGALAAATRGTDLVALFAPLDVVLSEDTVVEPDLLVAVRSDFGPRDLPVPPLLAVEVRSPSTWRVDRFLKHARYAAGGIASYWIVDPEAPSITAWRLAEDGSYEEVAHAVGDEPFHANDPVSVTIVPSGLTDDWQP